eukprot:XP_003724672.1 PREDICTED: uncharacterized protein LOC100887835 [Strongylocentrotus purpuratus]
MKSFIIGVCLLACLSFEIGHSLECYSCGSFKYQTIDLGTCGADTLAKITCETNKTRCAKVEFAGNLAGDLSSETFTFTLRGCTDVEATSSMDGCSEESAKADEIVDDVGVVGYSEASYLAFKSAIGTTPTYSSVAACTCTDELCNSAGGLQASFVVICVSLVMAVFAKII